MAVDRIAIVREALDAMNRRDVDALLELSTEDTEFVPLRGLLEGTVYRGEAGLREFFEDSDATWESLELHIERAREIGGIVAGALRMTARARTSHLELTQEIGGTVEFEGERMRRILTYQTEEEALRAAREAAVDSSGS